MANIFDIHAHPSLKTFVFGHDITTNHPHPAKDWNTIDAQVDLHSLKAGGITTMVAVHYLIEKDFVDKWNPTIRLFSDIAQWIIKKKVVEQHTPAGKPMKQLYEIMDSFEDQIQKAGSKGFDVGIAKNLMELRIMLSQGKTVFLHSIEGANCLNTLPDSETVCKHIEDFAERGVCQFTIGHFEDNILVCSQGGIPPHSKKTLGYKGALPDPEKELTDIGVDAVNKLLDLGIIIDMVHCTPATRKQIIALNKLRSNRRPLVLSHTGLRSVASKGEMGKKENGNYKYQQDLYYLPEDDEVKEIINTRGVIGVIFMNYWLNGTEEDNLIKTDRGIPSVVETMKKIRELEKQVDTKYDCDHIAIGTDMDGFTQRPDDLTSPSDIPHLIDALRNSDFTSDQIEKITWKNYMRVLELGWGN